MTDTILKVLSTKRGGEKEGSKISGQKKNKVTSAYPYNVTTWGQVNRVSVQNNTKRSIPEFQFT
jgi:hypothetical protein